MAKITNGLGLTKDQKKEFYKKEEIKKWLEDVDINSAEQLESARAQWRHKFTHPSDPERKQDGGDEGEPDDPEFEPTQILKLKPLKKSMHNTKKIQKICLLRQAIYPKNK